MGYYTWRPAAKGWDYPGEEAHSEEIDDREEERMAAPPAPAPPAPERSAAAPPLIVPHVLHAAATPAQYGVEGITLGAIIEGLNNTTTKADENIKNTPAPHKLKVRGKVRTRGVDSIPYNRRHGHRKP